MWKKTWFSRVRVFLIGCLCVMWMFPVTSYGADAEVWELELPLAKRLATFGKVWGILKYFHPQVATGEIDWDQALIDALPCVKEAADFVSFNQELDNLIVLAGDVDKETYNPDASAYPNEELFKWLKQDPILSDTVREKLQLVHTKYQPKDNYYVGYKASGTVSLANETSFGLPHFPDEGHRILALFRYWNIVNYFAPYRDLIDEPWEDVLEDLALPFLNAGDAYELGWPMAEMAARVDDTHAALGNAYQYMNLGFYYAPVEVIYVEGKTVVNRVWPSLMQPPGGLRIGDVILETKGQDIDTFRASMIKYAEGSNEPVRQRQVNDYVVRHTETSLPFKIERDGQVMDVVISGINYYYIYILKGEEDAAQEMWKILPGNIGYVNLGVLYREDVDVVMPQLMNTRAIVFDVRWRPHGTQYLLANWLNRVPEKFVKIQYPVENVPGAFYMAEYVKIGEDNPDNYKGKVILLVNEQTQSHGEFVCMAIQSAPDVTVVGSQTAGADGNVVYVPLPGGNGLYFSGLGIYYPNGHPTQQVGIVPDIYVRPTVEGIRQGRDEVLERAIQFVD